MDQDDPQRRLAELERERLLRSEQQRIDDLNHQMAAVQAGAQAWAQQGPPPLPPKPSRWRGLKVGRYPAIGVLFAVLIPVIILASIAAAAVPSSTMWMTRIVCGSGSLSSSSSYSYGGNGSSRGVSSSFDCVNGTQADPVSQFVVIAIQAVLIGLVLCGAAALVVLILRLRRRARPGVFLPVFVTAAVGVLVFAVVANVIYQPTGPTQLQSADGLNGLLATARDRFGDTIGYTLTVYPDYAILDRDVGDEDQAYYYEGGNWSSWGSATSNDHLSPIDLSEFDVAAVTAQLKDARQALHMHDDAKTEYLQMSRAKGGVLTLEIVVQDGDTGIISLNADGTVKSIVPP